MNSSNFEGVTPLIKAAMYNRPEIIEVLLAAGASLEGTNDLGYTALHLAAANGHLAATKVLLDAGAACSAADGTGRNAFMLAASGGHLECCELLLDVGGAIVSLASRDKRGMMAIDLALSAPGGANAALVTFLNAQADIAELEGTQQASTARPSRFSALRRSQVSAIGSSMARVSAGGAGWIRTSFARLVGGAGPGDGGRTTRTSLASTTPRMGPIKV